MKKKWKKSSIIMILAAVLLFGSIAVFAETGYSLTLYKYHQYSTVSQSVLKRTICKKGVVFIDSTTNSGAKLYIVIRHPDGTVTTSLETVPSTAGQRVDPVYSTAYQSETFAASLSMASATDDAFYTVSGQWTPDGPTE